MCSELLFGILILLYFQIVRQNRGRKVCDRFVVKTKKKKKVEGFVFIEEDFQKFQQEYFGSQVFGGRRSGRGVYVQSSFLILQFLSVLGFYCGRCSQQIVIYGQFSLRKFQSWSQAGLQWSWKFGEGLYLDWSLYLQVGEEVLLERNIFDFVLVQVRFLGCVLWKGQLLGVRSFLGVGGGFWIG